MNHLKLTLGLAVVLVLIGGTASATLVCGARYGEDSIKASVAELDASFKKWELPYAESGVSGNLLCTFTTFNSPQGEEIKKVCNELSSFDERFFYNYHYLVSGVILEPPVEVTDYSGQILSLYRKRYIWSVWEVRVTPEGRYKYLGRRVVIPGNVDNAWYCQTAPSAIAYINGVFVTFKDAYSSLRVLQANFGSMRQRTPLKYDLLYNQTACRSGSRVSCLADLAETFDQRQAYLTDSLRDRWETFWMVLSGNSERASGQGRLEGWHELWVQFSEIFQSFDSVLKNKMLELTVKLVQRPVLEQDVAEHLEQLRANARKNISTVVVAHSQGNLFIEAIKNKYADVGRPPPCTGCGPPKINFVHVAPPALNLMGSYVLADVDTVIRGLGALMPGTTPFPNVEVPISARDFTGHGFLETYWDSERPAFDKVRTLILQALEAH